MSTPLISVIIPQEDHRGQTVASLRSFSRQTLSSKQYEIVVTSNRAEPELDRMVAQDFPHVKQLITSGACMTALYNEAARIARGKYLFVSEMHVTAQPNCLEEVIRYVEHHQLDGACTASDGINANRIASCEERLFREDLQQWKESPYCKVTIRGFAIKRSLWQFAGGFVPEYNHFAEVALGRKFTKMGCKVGYCDSAQVHHYNQTDLSALAEELMTYGYGEAMARDLDSELFEQPPTPQKPANRLARRLRFAHWQRAACMALLARAPLSDDAFYRLYKKLWRTCIHVGRLDYQLSRHQAGAGEANLLPFQPAASLRRVA